MLYTKGQLKELGLSVRGTYAGPLDLDYAAAVLADLALAQEAGRFVFDRLVIVKQNGGYNVVEILDPDNKDFEKYREGSHDYIKA